MPNLELKSATFELEMLVYMNVGSSMHIPSCCCCCCCNNSEKRRKREKKRKCARGSIVIVNCWIVYTFKIELLTRANDVLNQSIVLWEYVNLVMFINNNCVRDLNCLFFKIILCALTDAYCRMSTWNPYLQV